MTEPTPTKEQIEAATEIYNIVSFDLGLPADDSALAQIVEKIVAHEQAARQKTLKEAARHFDEKHKHLMAMAERMRRAKPFPPPDSHIGDVIWLAKRADNTATEILALIATGE